MSVDKLAKLLLVTGGLLFCINSLAAQSSGDAETIYLKEGWTRYEAGPHLRIFRDDSTAVTFEQIQTEIPRAAFLSQKKPAPNFGYSAAAYWIRFRIENDSGSSRTVLALTYPLLDHVDLWVIGGPAVIHRRTGDALPFKERDYRHRNFIFPIDIESNGARTVYIRVESTSSIQIPLALWSQAAFAAGEREEIAWLAFCFGMLAIMVFYNLFLYISLRESAYLKYMLYVGCMGLALLVQYGLAYEYFWPGTVWWNNLCQPLTFYAGLHFSVSFSRTFLRTAWLSPLMDRILSLLQWLNGGLALLALIVPVRPLILISGPVGLSTVFCVFSIGGFALLKGFRPARYFLAAGFMATLGAIAIMLRNLGVLPHNVFTNYALLLGMVLDVCLLSLALADRVNILKENTERLNRDLDDKVKKRTAQLSVARHNVEQALAEIRKLNEFTLKINATPDLDRILDEIFAYLDEVYHLEAVIVLFKSEEGDALVSHKTTAPPAASGEMIEYARTLRVPLDESGGVIYKTYLRKKAFYYPPGRRMSSDEFDRTIIERLDLESFLLTPLVVQGLVVGMVLFTSYNQALDLSRGDIRSISRFCDQISGAVSSASLFKQVETERGKSDRLLLNILPQAVADELREHDEVQPVHIPSATVLFTDFVGFTRISEQMPPAELIQELDGCFTQFDEITQQYNLEKLKTIGDAYMCAGGVPLPNLSHPVDACLAALEFRALMTQMREIKTDLGIPYWSIRIGIHTGPVTAGVVGKKKFAYDIWGDTVNTASRMESSGAPNRVNISGVTFESVREFFDCEYRGKVEAKGKGQIDMYFLNGLRSELRDGENVLQPNERFQSMYRALKQANTPATGRVD